MSVLLNRGYPMHFYLQFLKYGADCIRDLAKRTTTPIKTALITIDEQGNANYPSDYTAWVRIGYYNGQYVIPMVQGKGTMSRILKRASDGSLDTFGLPTFKDYHGGIWVNEWFSNSSYYGDSVGGIYNHGAGYETDIFQEMPDRCQFQFPEELAGLTIVMDYIGNINSCDHLTRVHPFSQEAIEQYIIWQMKAQARHYTMQEAREEERKYWNKERHLRAQIRPLKISDIERIFRRGYGSTIKT